MKKLFIAAILALCAVAANAQEYWINDNFNNKSGTNNFQMSPNNICVTTTNSGETEIEGLESGKSCAKSDGYSKFLVLKNGKADASFTVPNAGNIYIKIGAKVNSSGIGVKVSSNLGTTHNQTFTGLWQEKCGEYNKNINSPTPVTITMENTDGDETFIVLEIRVTKYNPTTTVSTTAITDLDYEYGNGASANKTFTISGKQLANGITVSLAGGAGSKYELSKNGTSDWSNTLTYAKNASNEVAGATVYVRLKSGQNAGTYNETVNVSTIHNTVASSGTCRGTTTATLTKTVSLTGKVTRTPEKKTYILVTSEEDLVDNGKYLIVGYKNNGAADLQGYYALGYQTTNNRSAVKISDAGNSPFVSIFTLEAAVEAADETRPFEVTLKESAGNWNLFDEINAKYLSPFAANSSRLALNAAAVNYSISIGQDNAAVMTATTNPNGFNVLQFNNTSLLFSSYNNTQSPVYLYRETTLPETLEFLLEEGRTAGFDEYQWKLKFGTDNWKDGFAVFEDNEDIQKITVNGKATVPAATYKTRNLEIGERGSLDVTAGTLDVAEDLVIVSADNAAGQFQVEPSAELTGSYTPKVKKSLQNTIWYHISLPFDVERISTENDTEYSVNGGRVHAKWYDTQDRANRGEKLSTSPSWRTDGVTKLLKNNAYQFGQNIGSAGASTTLYLTANKAHFRDAYHHSTCDNEFVVIATPGGHELHTGWNMLGNPHTMSYNLNSIRPTYVYDIDMKEYEEAYGSIEPFKAFFVQVAEDENTLSLDVAAASTLRSASALPACDEIKLGLSKDSSFTDWYRIRLTDNPATEGYDFNVDAVKMLSTVAPQLYRATSYTDYAIDVMPRSAAAAGTAKTLPLTYKIPAAGNYTISLPELPENIAKLLLIDKKENSATDLLTTPVYSFSAAKAETVGNRFELVFELLSSEAETTSDMSGSGSTGEITVTSVERNIILRGLTSPATLSVFDLAGKQIATCTNIDNNRPVTVNCKGIFIVKAENQNQTVTAKVILK